MLRSALQNSGPGCDRSKPSIPCCAQGIKLLGDCEFVAIFDADFKPEPDFLLRTVPYLVGNSEIGYVQTRWTFTNPEESYLTKVRWVFRGEMRLNFADSLQFLVTFSILRCYIF